MIGLSLSVPLPLWDNGRAEVDAGLAPLEVPVVDIDALVDAGTGRGAPVCLFALVEGLLSSLVVLYSPTAARIAAFCG